MSLFAQTVIRHIEVTVTDTTDTYAFIEFTASHIEREPDPGGTIAKKVKACLTHPTGTKKYTIRKIGRDQWEFVGETCIFRLCPPGAFDDQSPRHWRLSVWSQVDSRAILFDDLRAIVRLVARY